MGDRFLSSAGAGGNCARSMRLPDPSPALDRNCAPMGPEILSSTGAGVWRKAPMAFPGSSFVLDKCQSASNCKSLFRCKIPWPFFSRKPPALTSIYRRKSTIDPEIMSINVCQRPIFCDFPSVSAEILTAPLQIGTWNMGFLAIFPG